MTDKTPNLIQFFKVVEHIDWNIEQPEHYGSNIRLLKESAIRFARWTLHVDHVPEQCSPPFFDLAECIAPDRTPPSPHDVGMVTNTIAKRTLPWMYRWYWLLETERSIELKELDPFEPLLLCFQRGGRPHNHHGFLHIEHSISFPFGYGQWPESFSKKTSTPLFEIDLPQLDAELQERFK